MNEVCNVIPAHTLFQQIWVEFIDLAEGYQFEVLVSEIGIFGVHYFQKECLKILS